MPAPTFRHYEKDDIRARKLASVVGGDTWSGTSTVSADTSVADGVSIILVNASGGARTVNLPMASKNAKRVLTVKKIDATGSTVTIDGYGSETIDGVTTAQINVPMQAVTVHCDGSGWWII